MQENTSYKSYGRENYNHLIRISLAEFWSIEQKTMFLIYKTACSFIKSVCTCSELKCLTNALLAKVLFLMPIFTFLGRDIDCFKTTWRTTKCNGATVSREAQ